MTNEEWDKYLKGLPKEELQNGMEEYSKWLKTHMDVYGNIIYDVNDGFSDWLDSLGDTKLDKPNVDPMRSHKNEIRKTSDIENKNREISLHGDKLPPDIQKQVIDEIDNHLGIKTDKKLVEYGQETVDSMNKKNINLQDINTTSQKVDLGSTKKQQKTGLEKLIYDVGLGKAIDGYNQLQVRPSGIDISKDEDGFKIKAEIKGNIPSLRKSAPDKEER
ncbi:MAG: hypothetical protein LBH98_04000 [Chitinispirillales bacterium]|jgi:hypothetical protein|nr:hypothetical protein [Chitinispirillales bacterium]